MCNCNQVNCLIQMENDGEQQPSRQPERPTEGGKRRDLFSLSFCLHPTVSLIRTDYHNESISVTIYCNLTMSSWFLTGPPTLRVPSPPQSGPELKQICSPSGLLRGLDANQELHGQTGTFSETWRLPERPPVGPSNRRLQTRV